MCVPKSYSLDLDTHKGCPLKLKGRVWSCRKNKTISVFTLIIKHSYKMLQTQVDPGVVRAGDPRRAVLTTEGSSAFTTTAKSDSVKVATVIPGDG